MNWIKTSDRLPETNQRVLVYLKNSYESIDIAEVWGWDSENNKYKPFCFYDTDNGDMWFMPEYWMPLPNPPK